MHIQSAEFTGFRNLHGNVDFGEGLNWLVGDNGQGKTNIIEAIFVTCHGRSFRPGNLADLLHFDADSAAVRLKVWEGDTCTPVSVFLTKGGKNHKVGGRTKSLLKEVHEALRAVFFGPEDLNMVKGGPAARRDFIDRAIVYHHAPYDDILKRYSNLLKERNVLLRDLAANHPPESGLMESYEDELARWGSVLVEYRLKYLARVLPRAREILVEFSNHKLVLEGTYHSNWLDQAAMSDPDAARLREILHQRLVNDRTSDTAAGRTGCGPQTDDIRLTLNGHLARLYASQGEQRHTAVALKVAQVSIWKEMFGVLPVLLLDDVMSELDPERVQMLFNHLQELGIQTLVTTTSIPDVLLGKDSRILRIRDGRTWSESKELG